MLRHERTARRPVFTGFQFLRSIVPKFHNAGVRGSSPCVATKQNKGLAKAKPFFVFRSDYKVTTGSLQASSLPRINEGNTQVIEVANIARSDSRIMHSGDSSDLRISHIHNRPFCFTFGG